MSEAALTLSELVARIAAPGEDLAVLTDKLKGWIKEGLVQPDGARNPGTGHRRAFSQTALIRAAVLHAVTSQIGMPATRARGFSDLFKHSHQFFRQPTNRRQFVTIAIDGRGGAEIGTARAEPAADPFA